MALFFDDVGRVEDPLETICDRKQEWDLPQRHDSSRVKVYAESKLRTVRVESKVSKQLKEGREDDCTIHR